MRPQRRQCQLSALGEVQWGGRVKRLQRVPIYAQSLIPDPAYCRAQTGKDGCRFGAVRFSATDQRSRDHFLHDLVGAAVDTLDARSEEHTSELQSLMRISYAVFCL